MSNLVVKSQDFQNVLFDARIIKPGASHAWKELASGKEGKLSYGKNDEHGRKRYGYWSDRTILCDDFNQGQVYGELSIMYERRMQE